MSRKMHINRLDKDELIYELTIRGIGTGNCEEMRKRLSSAIQLEKAGDSLTYPKHPFTFEEDLEAVQKKLDELSQGIGSFEGAMGSSEANKLQTKLAHVLGRVDKMEPGKGEETQKRSELLALTLSLMETFNEKLEKNVAKDEDVVEEKALHLVEKKEEPMVPVPLSILGREIEENTFREGAADAPRSSALGDDIQPANNKELIKVIPPYKWNLKFSGDSKGMSINAFLERVDELRIARHVSPATLLNSGIDLFTGKAYQFYKDCRARVTTWEALVREFREEYQSAHHNEDLFEEIRKRTQHSSESIGVYLAVMSSYFNRLKCHISEQAKLQIIMDNLHPFYQERLGLTVPSTIAELRAICRRLEARRGAIQNYAEPSSRRLNVLERDLAFAMTDVTEDLEAVEVTPTTSRERSVVVCYRCNQPGHRAIGCALPKKMACFRCKREGYTVRTCPNCSNSGNGNRRF